MNCYQIMRGLKTLCLRIEESVINASQLSLKLSQSGHKVNLVEDTNILVISCPDEQFHLKEIEGNGHNLTLQASKLADNLYLIKASIEDFEVQLQKIS